MEQRLKGRQFATISVADEASFGKNLGRQPARVFVIDGIQLSRIDPPVFCRLEPDAVLCRVKRPWRMTYDALDDFGKPVFARLCLSLRAARFWAGARSDAPWESRSVASRLVCIPISPQQVIRHVSVILRGFTRVPRYLRRRWLRPETLREATCELYFGKYATDLCVVRRQVFLIAASS